VQDEPHSTYTPTPVAASGGSGLSAYTAKAQSYIPASASTALSGAGTKAQEGFDAVFNAQTRESVTSGLGKAAAGAAAGAAKLTGKAAWQIGKFASR